MAEKVLWVFYDSLFKTQSNPISTAEAQTAILKMGPQQAEKFLIWTTGWDNWQQLKSYLESDQKIFVSTFTTPSEKTDSASLDTIKAALKDILEKTQTQTAYKNKKAEKKEDTKSYSSIHLKEENISQIVNKEKIEDAKNFDGDEVNWFNIQKPTMDFSKVGKKSMHSRETRHELKIEVLLISPKGKTFRSSSKNISLTGSLLDDTIPFDYYDTVFDVVIINGTTKNPSRARVKLTAMAVRSTGGLTQRIRYHNLTSAEKQSLKNLLEDYLDMKKKSKAA